MNILVTGGAGFLGSRLCHRLVTAGHRVVALDNVISGSWDSVFLLEEQYPDLFCIWPTDVRNPIDLRDCRIFTRADQIYNLACPASPPRYQADPIGTLLTCVVGAQNVLDYALECNAVVLQASTSEVYGDPQVFPQSESYLGNVNPHGIRSCYDEGKRAAESLFMDYHRLHGVRVKILRIFNTYGPGMDPEDGRVVSNWIVRVLQGKPLEIYGDGLQTRSFCYVDDLLSGMIALANSPDHITGPVNCGNPVEITLLELADTILQILGRDLALNHLPAVGDDPRRRCPDITLAKSLLGWSPQTDLRTGLEKTVEYFQEVLNARTGSTTE